MNKAKKLLKIFLAFDSALHIIFYKFGLELNLK